MQESRGGSAAAYHQAHGWIITGGWGPKSTAESTRDGRSFQSFTELPIALSSHSIIALDDGGDAEFFVTGGDPGGSGYNSATFLYKRGKWIRVADMPTARAGKDN